MGGHVIDVIITAGQPTYLASIDSELHRSIEIEIWGRDL